MNEKVSPYSRRYTILAAIVALYTLISLPVFSGSNANYLMLMFKDFGAGTTTITVSLLVGEWFLCLMGICVSLSILLVFVASLTNMKQVYIYGGILYLLITLLPMVIMIKIPGLDIFGAFITTFDILGIGYWIVYICCIAVIVGGIVAHIKRAAADRSQKENQVA